MFIISDMFIADALTLIRTFPGARTGFGMDATLSTVASGPVEPKRSEFCMVLNEEGRSNHEIFLVCYIGQMAGK
jgi:hypothetical protein